MIVRRSKQQTPLPDSCLHKHPDAATPRRMPCGKAAGGPGGNVRARFLGSFFAARQRMNIKKTTRLARDEGAQYDRP